MVRGRLRPRRAPGGQAPRALRLPRRLQRGDRRRALPAPRDAHDVGRLRLLRDTRGEGLRRDEAEDAALYDAAVAVKKRDKVMLYLERSRRQGRLL